MANSEKVKLSQDELMELIDRTAQSRLKMTGAEFIKRSEKGKLEDSPAVRDILMLVRFGEKNKTIARESNSGVHKSPKQRSQQDRNRQSADAA